MEESKMHLINKLFNNETIRTIWDKEQEKYYVSVVDVVGVLSGSENPRKYWNKLKQRLKEEGNQTVTNCHQLKLQADDGKMRKTDVADIKTIFRIIQSVPSKKAEPIKQWLAKVGQERVQEMAEPSTAIYRARETYKKLGRSEKWIQNIMTGQETRNKLTD